MRVRAPIVLLLLLHAAPSLQAMMRRAKPGPGPNLDDEDDVTTWWSANSRHGHDYMPPAVPYRGYAYNDAPRELPAMFRTQVLPSIIILDLDYTLWPFMLDGIVRWHDNGNTPIGPDDAPNIVRPNHDRTAFEDIRLRAGAKPWADFGDAAVRDAHVWGLYEEAPRMLLALAAAGIELGIASSAKPTALMHHILRTMEVPSPKRQWEPLAGSYARDRFGDRDTVTLWELCNGDRGAIQTYNPRRDPVDALGTVPPPHDKRKHLDRLKTAFGLRHRSWRREASNMRRLLLFDDMYNNVQLAFALNATGYTVDPRYGFARNETVAAALTMFSDLHHREYFPEEDEDEDEGEGEGTSSTSSENP